LLLSLMHGTMNLKKRFLDVSTLEDETTAMS
jgi:hypothetical protein